MFVLIVSQKSGHKIEMKIGVFKSIFVAVTQYISISNPYKLLNCGLIGFAAIFGVIEI
jgi:hypothetical protein